MHRLAVCAGQASRNPKEGLVELPTSRGGFHIRVTTERYDFNEIVHGNFDHLIHHLHTLADSGTVLRIGVAPFDDSSRGTASPPSEVPPTIWAREFMPLPESCPGWLREELRCLRLAACRRQREHPFRLAAALGFYGVRSFVGRERKRSFILADDLRLKPSAYGDRAVWGTCHLVEYDPRWLVELAKLQCLDLRWLWVPKALSRCMLCRWETCATACFGPSVEPGNSSRVELSIFNPPRYYDLFHPTERRIRLGLGPDRRVKRVTFFARLFLDAGIADDM